MDMSPEGYIMKDRAKAAIFEQTHSLFVTPFNNPLKKL
jgi:hypothetical protein